MIIAISRKEASGQLEYNPSPTVPLHAGDILLAMGKVEDLARLEAMARG